MNHPKLFQVENTSIRALSWKEPYCTLMMEGKKETRTWPTKYRGLVLMCASKVSYIPETVMSISGQRQYDRISDALYGGKSIRPLGHAKYIGNLVDCYPMTLADEDACFVQYCDAWMEEKVNRKTGKTKMVMKRLWVHVYEDVRAIEPIPWVGSQGWTTLPKDFLSTVKFL